MPQHASSGKNKLRGGIGTRVLDIPADAGKNMGLFENLHGTPTPGEFANQLKASALKNYGAPFRRWLRELGEDLSSFAEILREKADAFAKRMTPASASAEVGRAVRRMATMSAAGALATQMEITGWEPGEAERACERCVEDWIAQRGGVGQFDAAQAISQVTYYIQKNEGRFPPLNGKYNHRTPNPAGYRRGDLYLIPTEIFQQDVCGSLGHLAVCKALKQKGLMEHDKNRLTVQVRVGKGKPRFYAVRKEILDE